MTPDAGATRIVYVHGSGPQPSRDALKQRLDMALFGRDQGSRSAVAYYADLLHPNPLVETAQIAIASLATRPEQATVTADAVEAAFVRRTSLAMNLRASAATEMEGILPRTLRALLLRVILRFFLRDAHRYFFESEGAPIRQRLSDVLSQESTPAIVVGHSLGSIVAYDVLSNGGAAEVPLLVTLGSPLAIDAVKELVHQPPRVPERVRAWLNAADLLDVAAADPTLANDYAPAERIRDVLVDNASASSHDFAAYLSTEPVRQRVRDEWMGTLT